MLKLIIAWERRNLYLLSMQSTPFAQTTEIKLKIRIDITNDNAKDKNKEKKRKELF